MEKNITKILGILKQNALQNIKLFKTLVPPLCKFFVTSQDCLTADIFSWILSCYEFSSNLRYFGLFYFVDHTIGDGF